MHEIARIIPFNYLSTLGTACHSNGLFRLEICQRNSVGNQNGGKGVHQSVWNGGFYHSFPMGYCCWMFISQENKHPLWFLNVFSFTLAWGNKGEHDRENEAAHMRACCTCIIFHTTTVEVQRCATPLHQPASPYPQFCNPPAAHSLLVATCLASLYYNHDNYDND